MARNYTRELLAAMRDGARIVGALPPREYWEMIYVPRNTHDPLPWVAVADPLGFRYNGRELKALRKPAAGPKSPSSLSRTMDLFSG